MKLVSGWLKGKPVILALVMLAIAFLLVVGNGSAQEGTDIPVDIGNGGVASQSEPASVEASTLVLIIEDALPWGKNSIEKILEANSIAFNTITSGNIGHTDLAPYFMIVVPSVQSNTFYRNWNANIVKVSNWVKQGGLLWMSGATSSVSNPVPLIPGSTITKYKSDDYNLSVATSHPWLAGVTSPIGPYSWLNHNVLTNYPPHTIIVARQQDSVTPTLLDYPFGYGRVLANGMTLEHAWDTGPHAPILQNSLLNMVNGVNLNTAGLSALPGNSYATYLGAAGDPISWSLDVFTGGSNAISSWSIAYDWSCNNVSNSLVGSYNANGTMGGGWSTYEWYQNGNQIVMHDYATYIGYIAGDKIGGWMYNPAGSRGCWEATRAPADELPLDQPPVDKSTLQAMAGLAEPIGEQFVDTLETSIEPDVSDWLTVTPGSGSMVANDVDKITISVAASAMSTNDYGLVKFVTNDPDRAKIYMPINLPKNFMPVVLNNFTAPFSGPFEVEPNNTPEQANGRLILGKDYFGSPNDASPDEERDWFYIDYNGSGDITVEITGFVKDAQAHLLKDPDYGTFLDSAYGSPGGSGNYTLFYNGSAGAGKYMIWLYAPPGHPTNTGDYTINVTVN